MSAFAGANLIVAYTVCRAATSILAEMEREDCRGQEPPQLNNPEKTKAIKKRGEEPLRQALYRISGVDLTGIDAIGVETVQVVLSEYGADLSRFPTEKQFVSHVTLAPHRPVTGGKPVKKKKRGSASTRVAGALRMAALSLRHSETAPGGPTTGGLLGASEAMWRYLPQPGNWPL